MSELAQKIHPKITETFQSVEDIFRLQVQEIKLQYKDKFESKSKEVTNYYDMKAVVVPMHKEAISIINGKLNKANNIIVKSTGELKQLIHEHIPDNQDSLDKFIETELMRCKEHMQQEVSNVKTEIYDFAFDCIKKSVMS